MKITDLFESEYDVDSISSIELDELHELDFPDDLPVLVIQDGQTLFKGAWVDVLDELEDEWLEISGRIDIVDSSGSVLHSVTISR